MYKDVLCKIQPKVFYNLISPDKTGYITKKAPLSFMKWKLQTPLGSYVMKLEINNKIAKYDLSTWKH